jgi:hypothetical protein
VDGITIAHHQKFALGIIGTPTRILPVDRARRQHCGCGLGPAALALFGSISARGANGVPDALGYGWQFDKFDAELGQRVCDGVRHRGESRRDPALTAAAHAEQMPPRKAALLLT